MMFLITILLTAASAEEPIHLGYLPMQNPDLFEGDIIGIESPEERNAIPSDELRWPNGEVFYALDSTLSDQEELITQAMKKYHDKTCIRFRPRVIEANYLRIFPGMGCYSHVGRTGGAQSLSLGKGCYYIGTIIHELGHAIGFYHEHNRSDRDDYLSIYWHNIQTGMDRQFIKLGYSENRLLTPFDYDSIMIYGWYSFSRDGVSKTMVPKDKGVKLKEPYDKQDLTDSDVERVNKLYQC